MQVICPVEKKENLTSLNQRFQNFKIELEGQFGLLKKKEMKVEEEVTHNVNIMKLYNLSLLFYLVYSATTVCFMRLSPGHTILILKL